MQNYYYYLVLLALVLLAIPTSSVSLPRLLQVLFISANPDAYAFQPENTLKLKPWKDDPTDTTLYDLEARAYHQMHNSLEQHRAQAYSLAWQGNLPDAIIQLEIAKREGGSFYQLSIIESDLRELHEMQDEQTKKK